MMDQMNAADGMAAHVSSAHGMGEKAMIHGRYKIQCFEYEGGPLLWEDEFDNLVTTAGKNHLLDNYITGSAFTQVGPYMGLISSVSYSAIAAADTMASHAGWTEAGSANAPTWSTPASGARNSLSWSAASAGAKALSAAASFTMSGAGTLKGAFLVLGSGAVVTNASTAGTLFSAGLFSGGDQVVSSGNVVTVSYSLSI